MLAHDHIDEETHNREELQVSQIYYGNRVIIARGGTTDISHRIVIQNRLGLPKGHRFSQLKAKNANILKCLFEVVDPKNRQSKALEFGDEIALKNLWDGKYLRLHLDKVLDGCFGYEIRMSDILDSYCVFKLGRTYSR